MVLTPTSSQLPYVVAFGLSALGSGGVAAWVVQRSDARGSRALAAVLATVSLWGMNSMLRVVVTDPLLTQLLLTTELTLGVATAVLFFVFGARYTDRAILDWPPVRYMLVGLVVGTFALGATNWAHGVVWLAVRPETVAGVTTLVVVKGPGHYLLTVLGYLAGLTGIYFLVVTLWRTPPARPALLSLVGGVLMMFGANLLPYLSTDLLVQHPTTLAPLGATFAAVGTVVAIRYDLFGVVIVARSTVVETLSDPMLVVDAEHRVLDANAAFRETFADPTRGTAFATACPALAEGIDFCVTDPQTVHVDGVDAPIGHYSVTVSPLESGTRRLGASLVVRDVSELTRTARQLERQNQQLDEIAYSAAHNLRNPLGVIGGYTELLRTHLDDSEGTFDATLVANSLGKVSSNAERMEAIVTDLLRVTHATKSADGTEAVAFGDLLRRVFVSLDDDRLDLTVARDGTVEANYERLRTLVETLLRSVSDRTDGQATVTAELTDDGFAVTDTAMGIDPQDAEVFLSYGYTTKYPGTGLGLAVARVLATGSEWTIDIDTDYTDGLRVVVSGATTTVDADAPAASVGADD
ncbi:histidine kinase N-terminal 7TM domain-containing protein [Halorarius litoreus]|uniref:histidine kinase N-terminal 7TM domain-containing protein n=1 Tax=Halorarius litoreus TaxID=2962676 RepID=UPI0020CF32F9|nr:histidine kinase N-terminal 7TM domain-containing protein [Halorarius litoreus]